MSVFLIIQAPSPMTISRTLFINIAFNGVISTDFLVADLTTIRTRADPLSDPIKYNFNLYDWLNERSESVYKFQNRFWSEKTDEEKKVILGCIWQDLSRKVYNYWHDKNTIDQILLNCI